MFGPHLMLDLYGCDLGKIKSVDVVSRWLDEMPDRIAMTKIMPPYVFKYSGLKPEDWGVSGIVLIAESHISIHTFPEKGYATIDLFTCKDFDTDSVAAMIVKEFGAKTYEKNVLNRGRHFPKDLMQNKQMLDMQRAQKESLDKK